MYGHIVYVDSDVFTNTMRKTYSDKGEDAGVVLGAASIASTDASRVFISLPTFGGASIAIKLTEIASFAASASEDQCDVSLSNGRRLDIALPIDGVRQAIKAGYELVDGTAPVFAENSQELKLSNPTAKEKVALAAELVVYLQEKARGLGKNLSGKGFSEVLVLAEMLGSESVD